MAKKFRRKNKKKTDKKIGIVMKYITMKNNTKSLGVEHAYTKYFSQFGNVVHINPFNQTVENVDLLVLPGGRDVYPLRYDAIPDDECGVPDFSFEYFDTYVLPLYLGAEVSVFGICRGMQTLYVAAGGEMVQHVDHPVSSPRSNRMEALQFMDEQPVDIDLEKWNSVKEYKNNGKTYYRHGYYVNSIHHQVCDMEACPDNIQVLATSKVYKTLEAFMYTDKPVIGVQWHPEEAKDQYSEMLIMNLLTANVNTNLKTAE